MEHFYRQYLTWNGQETSRDVSVTDWSGSAGKRILDVVFSLCALVLLAPVLLIAAIAVKLSSPGPVLFRQRRIGRDGCDFIIYKFRTMRVQKPGEGPSVTRKGDTRLTRAGALLRRLKVDEFPQLYNVVKGDMSLVGVRPKLPHHQTYALKYRPGITGAASLAFRDEEVILHQVSQHCLDEYQIHVMIPLKKQIDTTYMKHATFASDLRILAATALGRGERLDHLQLLRFQESLMSLDLALRVQYSPAARPELDPASLADDAVR